MYKDNDILQFNFREGIPFCPRPDCGEELAVQPVSK